MRGRHKRLLPLVIAICAVVAIVPIFGAYLLMRQDPDALLRDYLGKLEKRTGVAITFEDAGVQLFPMPAITMSRAEIRSGPATLAVGWLLLRPAYLELLRGNFAPAKIELLRPRLEAVLPRPLAEMPAYLKSLLGGGGKNNFQLGEIFGSGCGISMEQGDIKIADSANGALSLSGANCDIHLDADGISGAFQLVTLNLRQDKHLVFSVERLSLSGDSSLKNPLVKSNLKTTLQLRWPGILKHATLDLRLEGQPTIWDMELAFKGELQVDKAVVPAAVSGRLVGLDENPDISLRGFELSLDKDCGSLNAMFKPANSRRGAELAGTLMFERLSMTRWLGFARNLMPGLALALDSVTEGSLDFVLSGKSLEVPRMRACASGSCFSGKGGVADFSKPNVYLSLSSDFVNLGRAIPESIGNFPAAPAYTHPTLTPMPGKPRAPGEAGIDYDVNLEAKNVVYGPMKLTHGKARITQGQMDKSGLEDVLIYGEAKGYGGNVKGLCILGADKNMPLAITVETTAMRGKELARDLPFLPLSDGRLKGVAEIKSSGKKLDIFLANLRGSAKVEGAKPVLKYGGKNVELDTLTVSSQIAKGSFKQNILGLDAKWQAALNGPGLEARLSLNGNLGFGGKNGNLEFRNVPGKLSIKLGKPWRDSALAIETSGKFSAQAEKIEAAGAAIEAGALKANGNFQINYGKSLSWRGNLKTQTANLPESLKKILGKSPDLPEKLASLTLESDFSGKDGNLNLSKINAKIGPLAIGGQLAINYGGKIPACDFDLRLGKIDLAQFTSKKTEKNRKWDLSWGKSVNARGRLQIDELLAYSARFQRLSLPLTLENGKLKAGPGSCVFYGANLHIRGNADFTNNLSFGASLEALAFDLGKLCRDQKMKAELSGLANMRADVQARLNGPGQLPAALNGSWSFTLKDGSWQGLKKNGEPDGKPTPIKQAGATGIIDRGVAVFKNFQLRNDSMKADGGGWINLNNEKLDCNFNIDMRGLPNFPLRLYGTIGKTKTSIGAGTMVYNAIAGLTGGIINIFGGILEGLLNIFR